MGEGYGVGAKRGIPRTKIFAHKRYRLHAPYTRKADALRYQRIKRGEGYSTKLVPAPSGSVYSWLLYKHAKSKKRRKRVSKRVSRNPIKHMILGDLALHGISLLH